jgi:hypothetical protein
MQPGNEIFSENKQRGIKQYLNRYLEPLHNSRRNTT